MARRGWSTANFLRYGGAVVSAYPCTIAAWAKSSITATSTQYIAGVFNSAAAGNSGVKIYINSTGNIGCSANSANVAATSTTISANTWFHACGVFASTTDRRVFLNGGGKGTNATSTAFPGSLNRTSIGLGDGSSAVNPFAPSGTGDIAEVAFWNVALSDTDVASLANGIHPFLVHPEALVAYYPLIGAYSPEINRRSNTSVLTMQGTLTASAHPRVFYPGINSSRKLQASSSTQALTPSLFTNSQTFYAPTVATTYALTPSLFTNTNTFYSPTVGSTYTLTPSLFANSQTFYAATVTLGVVNLTPSLFTNTQTFYSPSVTVGAVNLTPSLFTNTRTFYSPTISTFDSLTPSLFTNTNTFYAATVAPGIISLTPSLLTNTQTFYSPTISATYGLTPSLFTNTNTFYSPTVATSNNLAPNLFTNNQIFYAATVTGGDTTASDGGEGILIRRRRRGRG